MDYLPIFLNVRNRPCLVVGGGEVATRKVTVLLEAHAQVTVLAPQITPTLTQWVKEGKIHYLAKPFAADDLTLARFRVIYAATNHPEVNRQVYELADEQGIAVNVADNPPLCSFIMPSLIDRSPIQVAVSSGGASPVLARQLRAKLETSIPEGYGRLGQFVERFRTQVKTFFSTSDQRRRFWEEMLQSPIAEMVLAGHEEQAAQALQNKLQGQSQHCSGEVYLVGGGPGDPDLLTFRALRLMQQAEVVVHDRLVSKAVLDLCRKDAQRIYVGKEQSNHALAQEDINQLLARLAKEGKRVLRLKGGDPFIFGRGGEEIETLAAQGVPFQVVPGITAASGMAAYAGIPLTHRDYAQSCVFVTGHLKDNTMNLNWEMLVQPNQTVVVYMGLSGLAPLCEQLIAHGMAPEQPAALVQQATTPRQRVFIGTLASLPATVNQETIEPPTLIIVGDVVKLHQKLAWFTPSGEQG